MRKIIALEFLTLDGIMQAPGGSEEDTAEGFQYGGWTAPFFDDSAGNIMAEQMKQPFSLLLGRKTFKIFESYWPAHDTEWPGINEATKYVVSRTLSSSDWQNSVFLKGDIVKSIIKIKAEKGPPLQIYGSGNLIQTLLKHELIDEFWLKIFPVILGKGKKLFDQNVPPATFKFLDSQVTNRGVIFANYRYIDNKIAIGAM